MVIYLNSIALMGYIKSKNFKVDLMHLKFINPSLLAFNLINLMF